MKVTHHNYEYEVDTSSETASANVVRMVGQSKRVLEIGCGPGSITKVLAQQGGCQVTGIELDHEAIKEVTPYCVQVMQADLNSSEWPSLLDGVARLTARLLKQDTSPSHQRKLSLQRVGQIKQRIRKGLILLGITL